VIVGGRLLQALVPTAEKDRSPSVDINACGTDHKILHFFAYLNKQSNYADVSLVSTAFSIEITAVNYTQLRYYRRGF